MRTRFAPTPSGFLHFGNFCNLIFTFWFAKTHKAQIFLRIDDYDETRTRDIYIDDILRVVELLKLDFTGGPSSVADFKANFSQSKKKSYYYEQLSRVANQYHCDCTRKMLQGHKIYPRTCSELAKPYELGKTQIRYRVKDTDQEFYKDMGDFVLWRKEGIPAYQWVSVIDDIDLGVTDIIRGEDLKLSSLAQSYLADTEGLNFCGTDHFYHHKLINSHGKKLSKSQNAPSLYEELKTKNGIQKLTHRFCEEFALEKMDLNELFLTSYSNFLRTN